jgi:superfamily II RNA helicase
MVKICVEEYNKDSKYNKYFEEFPFDLSDFQKYAIESIVEGCHCLVTAHTGSGKTLPAEFGIKYMTGKGKKVIYTSPIKALSNQKFYDFKEKYPELSIGLFTGDIKTNPEADVLIMTTEILMNYLFNMKENESLIKNLDFEIDIQNELGCVVFDEVHYINDEHRGDVWEKTILMLPEHVQMIMLSATIDGPEKFAKWCEDRYNNKEVYLCSTDHRVVPLGHYSYITSIELFYKKLKDKDLEEQLKKDTSKLIEIQTPNGKFNEENVNKIKKILTMMKNKDIYMKKSNVLNSLCSYLKRNEMLPGIVFIFSRKLVERTAEEVTVNLLEDDSKIPYIVKKECDTIIRKLPNYEEYLNLEEYKRLVKLLEKGVGIHHSGMIPVLREIVEMMISKKYIKLLFATESFAIGLDCPIKTAIFPSLKKFDGNGIRELYAHEYTQMAGRAGRRGIDTVGYVVHCNNLFDMPFITNYKKILSGVPQTLVSKYTISFSIILNLIKNGKSKELVEFSEKTMLNEKLIKTIASHEKKYEEMKKEDKELGIDMELMNEYNILYNKMQYMKSNKQKKAMKNLMDIKEKSKTFDIDYKKFIEVENNKYELKLITKEINDMKSLIKQSTTSICDLLIKEKYIEKEEEEEEYILTEKGKIASMIAEVNNTAFTQTIIKEKYFEEYKAEEIISALSFMIDIKTNDEIKSNIIQCNNYQVKRLVERLNKELNDYSILELNYNIRSGIDYECVNYDIPDIIEGWLECENEEDCKKYMKEIINEKYQIMTGEFIKCLLKLCALSKEINKMSEELGYMNLLNKMQHIEDKILKYVVTPQSLYL